MRLAHLELSCVRNLAPLAIDLVAGLNVFIGANGAGKTSLLESIHLLARGRSFRTAQIGAIIQWGCEALRVRAVLTDDERAPVYVALQKRRDNVAEVRINGQPERRLSAVAALLPVQTLLPEGADLVLGAPSERRRFLDWGMFHVEPSALDALRNYQRALRQRNVVLRALRGGEAETRDLATWDARVTETAGVVHDLRNRYVAALTPHFAAQLVRLAPSLTVELHYQSGWPEGVTYEKSLRDSRPRDVKLGVTHPGPHRADMRLKVAGHPAAQTLSRGQAKVVASALRLAQAVHIAETTGARSVFLMDDVGAELDQPHSERFLAAVAAMGCQVLATTATSDLSARLGNAFGDRLRVFHVEQGLCSEARLPRS